ncbi:MAG: hypothetical protein IPO21_12405 [Bacteroidales bacterium]|nr:hypothetical protein [Bacteroidales bacterium]
MAEKQNTGFAKSMIQDNNKLIWVSTGNGIFSLNTKTEDINYYNSDFGMYVSEFNINATHKSTDGTIYFGSKTGFVSFNPSLFVEDTIIPKLILRDVYINNGLQKPHMLLLKNEIKFNDTIVIKYSKSIISLEFSDLNHIYSPQIKIQYLVEGLLDKWVPLDDSRKISFTDLAPGTYKIHIKASYRNSLSKSFFLYLKVVPPWWKTLWFNSILIFLLILLIYIFYLARSKYIREQNKILKFRVAQKTSALEEVNNTLLEKNRLLQDNEFKLQVKNDELVESNITKDKLFSIIAHDKKPFICCSRAYRYFEERKGYR